MHALAQDVVAYATLAARLAQAGEDREAVLAAHGLDEESWEAIDDAWQERLAEDEDEDQNGVPVLVAAYAEAFAAAQRGGAKEELPFERYVEVASAMKRGGDLANVLGRFRISLPDFLRAHQHWTAQMLEDEELARRFRKSIT